MGAGAFATAMACWRLALAVFVVLAAQVDGLPTPLDAAPAVGEAGEDAQPLSAPLSCHTYESAKDKGACCKSALDAWLRKQALYKQMKSAKEALLLAPRETEQLKAASSVAKAKFDASEMKRTYAAAVRDCSNSVEAYQIPYDKAATVKRETAEAVYAAAQTMAKQSQSMTDYKKVSELI